MVYKFSCLIKFKKIINLNRRICLRLHGHSCWKTWENQENHSLLLLGINITTSIPPSTFSNWVDWEAAFFYCKVNIVISNKTLNKQINKIVWTKVASAGHEECPPYLCTDNQNIFILLLKKNYENQLLIINPRHFFKKYIASKFKFCTKWDSIHIRLREK